MLTVSTLKMIVNAVIVYAVLVLLMRLIGKRQLGELELTELVVTILISEIASRPITDPESPLAEAFVPVVALMGVEYLLSVLSVKSVKLRALLSGRPALLIVRGRIDQKQMRKNRITPDELSEALRSQGVLDLNDVEYAVLETNGQVNVIQTPAQRPATAGQLGVQTTDRGWPFTVVNNGRVLSENLRLAGRDERWLMKTLREQGVASPQDVYMMTVGADGGVFLAPMERP